MAERLCRHEPCHCEPPPDAPFCGEACRSAGRGEAGDACACGHPECHPEEAKAFSPKGQGPHRPRDVRGGD